MLGKYFKTIVFLMTILSLFIITSCSSLGNNIISTESDISNGVRLSELGESQFLNLGFRSEYDEIADETIYRPSKIHYSSLGVEPIIVKDNSTGKYTADVFFYYDGQDWIFFDKLIIKTDNNTYDKTFDLSELDRDVYSSGGGEVLEKATVRIDNNNYEMFDDMATSSKVLIRFQGEHSRDLELTDLEKHNLYNTVQLFECDRETSD